MRIPSGTTDQYLYFFAADETDFVTPETGFGSSGWTVVRSRNGAADATYTTPTVSEIDNSTMPGWYALLLDEDMTIGSGNDSEEVALHITHAGMAPARRVFELYRRTVSDGETLNVSSGALNAISDGLLTAAKFGADCITAAKVAADVGTEIAAAVWGAATRLLTGGDNIVLAKGTGITGFNDVSEAQVNAQVDTALADYDPPTKAELDSAVAPLATAANLATVAGYLDTEIAAILEDTGTTIPAQITALNNLSAADVNAQVDIALADYDGPTNAEMEARTLAAADYATATALGTVDSVADAIKAVTDNLPDSGALTSIAQASALQTVDDEIATIDGIVDDIKAKTDNLPASPAATGDIPTAAAISDAVWEEALTDHSGTSGSTAAALAAAGSAGDPWSTAIPGSYTAGQAGKIVGDYLDAAVSGRASQTSVDAVKVTTDKLDDTLENDGGTYRFTANALEEGPAGSGGGATAQEVWEYATRTLTALDEDSTTVDLDATIRAAVGMASANLDDALAAIDSNVDTVPDAAAIADEVETRTLMADIRKVNNIAVTGAGVEGDAWRPS